MLPQHTTTPTMDRAANGLPLLPAPHGGDLDRTLPVLVLALAGLTVVHLPAECLLIAFW